METAKDRLYEFIDKHLCISRREFERRIGLSNGALKSTGDGLSENLKTKIHDRFDYLNIQWVESGVGDMIIGHTTTSDKRTTNEQSNSDGDKSIIASLIKEMTEQRIAKDLQIQRSQDQIDRLITMLEDRGASLHKAQ